MKCVALFCALLRQVHAMVIKNHGYICVARGKRGCYAGGVDNTKEYQTDWGKSGTYSYIHRRLCRSLPKILGRVCVSGLAMEKFMKSRMASTL